MVLNNTSKSAAMSAQNSQAAPISTPKVNRPNKRRRSPEPQESERPALRSDADSSNGQISPASEREDERYLSNTARNHRENVAHKDRRQRVSGELTLVHDNGVCHPSDQKETRQPSAKTIGRSSTNATVPKQDQPRIGIVTLQPMVFGMASSRPNALQSSKLGGHLTPPTSPIVPQTPASLPFTSCKSLGGGFDSLSDVDESVFKTFVNSKEELFGRPAVGSVEKTPQVHNPRRKKAFDVCKDVPQSSDPRDSRATASDPSKDMTGTQKNVVGSRQGPWEASQEPAAVVKRGRKRMRVEEGEHHHANLKDFRFSCKPNAEGNLREGSFKRVKMPGDQPFPSVAHGQRKSPPAQDFTSKYFTEAVELLVPETLEDVLGISALDQNDTIVHERIYSLAKAQQVPVAELTNIGSPPPNIGNEMLFRPFQSFEEGGTVFRPSRSAAYDAQVTVDEPWQCQEFSQGDETTLREFNNHQELPPDAGIVTTSGVASIIVPIVPSWITEDSRYSIGIDMAYREGYDPEHPRNYEHYIAQFTARPAYPRAKEYEYCPMPEMLDVEAINQRLNWVVPDYGEAPRRLRELSVPPPHIDSELARCVRFAQSDSQRRVNWRTHPSHVAEIIQRTNFYGMELLISRGYVRISCPPTIDEFELAMATRLEHASFGKDPVTYIAADVRALADYLVRDIPSAMCLILNDEEDHFTDFSRFYRAEFADKHPPFDEIGLPTWRLLLKGEMGIPSLRAQSLRAIIDSIEAQTAQALLDGRIVWSLANGVFDEDAHLNNENATNYPPCSDLDYNLGGSNVDGGFGWTIGEFNADLSDFDCIQGWDEYSASLNYQSNKEGALGEFLDPVYAGADGGALEPMADLDPSQTFWSNQSPSVPSNCAQDMSAPVINVFSSEASTVESFFR